MSKASMKMEIGRLLCGQVRDFLNSCKFNGMDIDYIEGSGILSKTFTVKGNAHDMVIVHRSLVEWSKK